MKIVHLVAYSIWSGPVPAVFGLATAQREQGHKVSLCYDTKRDNMGGVEEVACPLIEPSFPHQPLTLSTKSTPLEWMGDCSALGRIFRDEQPDVVHVHLSHDHVLAKTVLRFSKTKPKPKLVRTVHARRSLAKRFGQHFLYRDLDGLIFRSDEHFSLFKEHFGLPKSHAIVPSGIDLERFSPGSHEQKQVLRKRWGIPPEVSVVCHAGLIAGRGQIELLEAVQSLGDTSVWILYMGGGEGEPALDQRIEELEMRARVVRAGYLEGAALVDAYRCSDIAFVGRLGNDAGGRIALEPMACGLPLVGNVEGALRDIVRPEFGWPCDRLDVDEIASRLGIALSLGRDELFKRGHVARQWVEVHRSFETEARETLALYEQALAS